MMTSEEIAKQVAKFLANRPTCKSCLGQLTVSNTSRLYSGSLWHLVDNGRVHASGLTVTLVEPSASNVTKKSASKPTGLVCERLARICCPKCGNVAGSEVEESRIEYIETFDMYRVVSVNPDGQLEVTRTSSFVEGSDGDGKNPRFRCQKRDADGKWCGHTWPVPEWVEKALWEAV